MLRHPYRCLLAFGLSLLIGAGPGLAQTSRPADSVDVQTSGPDSLDGVLRRVAFGSCAAEDQPQPFWDAVLADDPDLFLFIGDNVYGDTEDMDTLRAKYAELAGQPGFQRLLETAPVLATWDDHDYGENDAGKGYPMKEASKDVFMDFFDVPEGAPMREREGIYHAHTFGPEGRRVQVILLDTRSFRDSLQERPAGAARDTLGPYMPTDDTTRTMLGEAQWDWLEGQLREPADVRLLVSSVQAIPEEHGWEKWKNLPHERERLFGLIRETGAEGVVLLSGDRHLAEISRLDADVVGYPLYEVTSSGLNRGGGGRDDEPNRHRLGENFRADNYGLLTLDWDAEPPTLTMEVFDDEGRLGLRERVPLPELRRDAGGTSGR